MVQKVCHFIVCVAASQVHFISDEDDWNFIINFGNSCHPICFEPLYAVKIVNIIHQYDNISLFNL